jgi:hypothetical protein
MFRALLAHLQKVLHKQQSVYCVRVTSVGCYQGCGGTLQSWQQPTDVTHTQYTNCCLCSASWRWASSACKMYRLLIHDKINTKSAFCWFYSTENINNQVIRVPHYRSTEKSKCFKTLVKFLYNNIWCPIHKVSKTLTRCRSNILTCKLGIQHQTVVLQWRSDR